ncbi:BZ3500_MvSof-1268-A1-R1_Chr5-2g07949 [Microbotryum saponariae]|uniref:BZ3500_MvSof-1268-A1-R1_Chr5-2g07949 protein n=1 Tax=Microbotryum saponariae TaxID=289078 RepID=A0A2X0L1I0_9BASI|nr:BZ3500_MvSof-1268-A1-R1_Chr5-2g07949 [Microbotryum saponariae]SDA05818.1 BZ3501_MvSof-1269-A2-R1_Chr5-2g07771 [Microbotryum saponariae]
MSLQSLRSSLLRSTRSLNQTRPSHSTVLTRSSFILRRSQHTLSATPEQFKAAIKSEQTTLVDFYAEWCGPCKQLTPVLKQVIASDSQDVHCKSMVTIDTDDHYELASEYKISALPTVIAFRNGEPIGKFVGGRNQSGVESFLEEVQA